MFARYLQLSVLERRSVVLVLIYCSCPHLLITAQADQDADQEYSYTPLDFISRQEQFMSQVWVYYTEILRSMRLAPRSARTLPVHYVSTINFLAIGWQGEIVAAALIVSYSAFSMFCWKDTFPSHPELILWRCASVYTLVFGILGPCLAAYHHVIGSFYEPVFGSVETLPNWAASWRKLRLKRKSAEERAITSGRVESLAERLRNSCPHKHPRVRIPLRIFLPVIASCAIYCACRAYILIEDLIGLRRLPSNSFETVDWSRYLPHL